MIPVAIRAEVACPVYVDPNHNPRLSLAKGEAYISDHNFVHGYVKTNAASLEPNPEYDLMIKLFSAEHPGWEPKQTYILIVPGKNDSNSAFTLIPC